MVIYKILFGGMHPVVFISTMCMLIVTFHVVFISMMCMCIYDGSNHSLWGAVVFISMMCMCIYVEAITVCGGL